MVFFCNRKFLVCIKNLVYAKYWITIISPFHDWDDKCGALLALSQLNFQYATCIKCQYPIDIHGHLLSNGKMVVLPNIVYIPL
jgi:hypothetical protein